MLVLYDYLMRFVGTNYKWGGDDPMDGFDCSGLAIEFLSAAGILPKGFPDTNASGLHAHLKSKGAEELKTGKFGALIFFGKPELITHVGICIDPMRMIEAGGGGSATTSREAAAQQNAFVRVRPLNWRKDVVAILLPKYATTTM
jgi:cell wall-associated NlpC family hydrolase